MKMKIVFALLLMAQAAAAQVIVSEVMYAPTQTPSETDSEWLELYNQGNESIDLKDYKINGYNFDDYVLAPDSYLVVARELTDENDEDTESFESYWGNNDGIWNEEDAFQAVDGYFSLSNKAGIINLTSPSYTYSISYSEAQGSNNGRSLIWNGTAFMDGRIDGTPGRGETSNNEVLVTATIKDSSINLIDLYINGRNDTYELLPFTDTVAIAGTFSGQVINASFLLNNEEYPLLIENNTFSGEIPFAATSGSYEALLFLEGYTKSAVYNITLTVPKVISTTLQGDASFGELELGTVSGPKQLQVINKGNTPVSVSLAATDLSNNAEIVSKGVLEVFVNNNWVSLSNNINLGSLATNSNTTLTARMNVPGNIVLGKYQGYLKVVSRAL